MNLRLSCCTIVTCWSLFSFFSPLIYTFPTSTTTVGKRQQQQEEKTSDGVCYQELCLIGSTGLKAGVTFTLNQPPATNITGSTNNISSVILLAGQYELDSLPQGLPSFVSSDIVESSGFNNTTPPPIVNIVRSQEIIIYSLPFYQGISHSLNNNNTNNPFQEPSLDDELPFSSILLPNDTLVVAENDNDDRIVFWDSIPDTSFISSSILHITSAHFLSCPNGCSSGGTCNVDGDCECKENFTGNRCESCAPNTFGRNCERCSCPADQVCQDGVTGNGLCVPAPRNTTSPCNCANGVCNQDGTCTCNAGWATLSNDVQCSTCAEGFSSSTQGNDCLACFPGCTTCTDTECQSCQNGLQVSENDRRLCEVPGFIPSNESSSSFATCPTGQYPFNGQCETCDPICESCYGPGPDSCLKCLPPRGLLASTCVDVDSSTGICDKNASTSLSDNQKADNSNWIFDNEKNECDALPEGCTTGRIPNFSVNASRASIECTECTDERVLYQGSCITECPPNTITQANECIDCDSECSRCGPSSPDQCLSCSDDSKVALNGECQDECPDGMFAANGTCFNCHPDCKTCSASSTNCLSCPEDRPILIRQSSSPSSTCDFSCQSSNEYYDKSSRSCQTCSVDCATCKGGATNDCLSCKDGFVLNGGTCESVVGSQRCTGEIVIPGFGTCLDSLVTLDPQSEQSSNVSGSPDDSSLPPWAIVLLTVLPSFILLGAAFYFLRRYNQRKRSKETASFAESKSLGAQMFHWFYTRVRQRKLIREYERQHKLHRKQQERENQEEQQHEYHRGPSSEQVRIQTNKPQSLKAFPLFSTSTESTKGSNGVLVPLSSFGSESSMASKIRGDHGSMLPITFKSPTIPSFRPNQVFDHDNNNNINTDDDHSFYTASQGPMGTGSNNSSRHSSAVVRRISDNGSSIERSAHPFRYNNTNKQNNNRSIYLAPPPSPASVYSPPPPFSAAINDDNVYSFPHDKKILKS